MGEQLSERLTKPIFDIPKEQVVSNSPEGALIRHPAMGFQMSLPQFAGVEKQRGIVFSWNFPPTQNFADNVNVMVQDNELPFGQLLKDSVKELEKAGLKVVKVSPIQKKGFYYATIEYMANLQGRNLHWLAMLSAGDQKFYIVTCTALEDTFISRRPEFEKIFDSFLVIKK